MNVDKLMNRLKTDGICRAVSNSKFHCTLSLLTRSSKEKNNATDYYQLSLRRDLNEFALKISDLRIQSFIQKYCAWSNHS